MADAEPWTEPDGQVREQAEEGIRETPVVISHTTARKSDVLVLNVYFRGRGIKKKEKTSSLTHCHHLLYNRYGSRCTASLIS